MLLDKPQRLCPAKCAAGGVHPGPRECVPLAAAPGATRLPWAQPQPSGAPCQELALRVLWEGIPKPSSSVMGGRWLQVCERLLLTLHPAAPSDCVLPQPEQGLSFTTPATSWHPILSYDWSHWVRLWTEGIMVLWEGRWRCRIGTGWRPRPCQQWDWEQNTGTTSLLTVTREPSCCREAWCVPHGAAGLLGALPGAV